MRDSGVIFRSTLETCLDMVYDGEEDMAFHYLLTAVEKTLDADITYDDPRLKYVYGELDRLIAKSHDRFDKKVQSKEQANIDHYQLEEIAEMFFSQGLTQRQIADRLGNISQQGVSGRIKMIRSKYPELIEKYNSTTNFTIDTILTTNTTDTSSCTTGTTGSDCITTDTTGTTEPYNSYNQYNSYNGYNSNVNVNVNENVNDNGNVNNNVNDNKINFSFLDFKKKVYTNSYEDDHFATGQEILNDYNLELDDERIEMANEFPEAYDDLVKLGIVKKEWRF